MKTPFKSGAAANQLEAGPVNIVDLRSRAAPEHRTGLGPMARLSVDTPKSVMLTLKRAATERECTVAFIVHEALAKAGYDIPAALVEKNDRRARG